MRDYGWLPRPLHSPVEFQSNVGRLHAVLGFEKYGIAYC